LIGSGALFSLIKAGAILADSRCIEAVRRFLDTMNAQQGCVAGTHSFLSALYAHVADAALRQPTTGAAPKELRTISCAK
jgi:hypothetical protein